MNRLVCRGRSVGGAPGFGRNNVLESIQRCNAVLDDLCLIGQEKESDPATKYMPELKIKEGAFADATFGQVLNMTNSMDFTEVYDDPKSNIMTYVAVLGWKLKLEGIEYPDSLYDYLVTLDIDKKHKHGEIFHYLSEK